MKSFSVEDLVKSYKGRRVVDGVSLYVHPGEVVGLLGANGAGKTTTFYMTVGLVEPDEGSVLLNGEDITDKPMYKRARLGVGYLAQEPSVFRKLTVSDNIRAVLEFTDLSGDELEQRLQKLMKDLSVEHLADIPAYSLSGGERRRVEIARALVNSPSFMLLDEPFSGIDPIVVGEIQGIVRELKSNGMGILITDHNVGATLGICDRAYIIDNGKILASGSPDEITCDDKVRE
ncbi:MAG: LPS export ABC transporter ATP-binding protein, partial [Deltaproteobacteria bacterium]|nr:LPS export ABC transporter ATP-binding protein [Deltaproteobacteria bacterium]